METDIIPAPNTNGHADGYRRLGELEGRLAELDGQLRAAHDRIDDLEEKLTPEGFTKMLENNQRAAIDKELRDNPAAREQLINLMLGQQQ